MEHLWRDIRHAGRVLARSPLFTITAALSLAVGIAGNAAIFALADALLLRDRPGIADPSRLVEISRSQNGEAFDNFSYPNYADYRDRNTVFTELAAYRVEPDPMGLGTDDGARRVLGSAVSENYFRAMGVEPALGRAFLPEEDGPNASAAVVVLSYELWRTAFGADPGVLATTTLVNGRPATIIGVAPEGFTGHTLGAADLWVPLALYADMFIAGDPFADSGSMLAFRQGVWLQGIGRLRDGVTLEQARAQMTQIAGALEAEFPDANEGHGVALTPSGALPGGARPAVTGFIALLFVLVGLILVIASTNVAGMLLARGVVRARETAVRAALGAAQGQIVRQHLVEGLVLAALGAAGGVVGAAWLVALLNRLLPLLPIPARVTLSVDWRVVAFSAGLALAVGLLSGLVPALHAGRMDVAGTIKDAGHDGRRSLSLRQAFVVAQTAMAVFLLVCALLFARSLQAAGSIDPGFSVEGVDAVVLDTRLAGYTTDAGRDLSERLLARVERIPGVDAAAYASVLPLTGRGLGLGRLTIPGRPPETETIGADWNVVSPGYFDAMRIPLVRGRAFTAADQPAGPRVAIVNATFAERVWPDTDPIGQVLVQGGPPDIPPAGELTIVGVVPDGKYRSLAEAPRAFIYVPFTQQYLPELTLLVRHAVPVLPAVLAAVSELDTRMPIVQVGSLDGLTSVGLLPNRVAAWLAAGVSLVGLLLVAIGLYGVTTYNVSQRTREIGVRVALGAAHRNVVGLVVRRAMALALGGLAAGLVLAVAMAQLLANLLYVTPLDLVSFAGAAALLTVLALAAAAIPALRAARLNPLDALRTE